MADKKNNFNTSDGINLATGAYSLISGLTSKKPGRFKQQRFTPNIRPVQGNQEQLLRTQQQIARETSSANRDVQRIAGSNLSTGLAARLSIQSNANRAINETNANNTALIQQDQNRVSQEQNQAGQINTQIANEESRVNFQQDQSNYQQRQAAARQGVQSSLNYISAKEANVANNKVRERQAQEQLDAYRGTVYQQAYNQAIIAGKTDPEEAAAIARRAMKGFESSGFYPKSK